MNKAELVDQVASKTGMGKDDVDKAITGMLEVVTAHVAGSDEKVSLPGYLSFQRVATAPRKGRNPQTGEEMQIPAGTRCKVTVLKKLKDAGKGA